MVWLRIILNFTLKGSVLESVGVIYGRLIFAIDIAYVAT